MNAKTIAESRPSWLSRHWKWLALAGFGYVGVIVALSLLGYGAEWINATHAYFVAANLIVLWWYADTTAALLESSRDQARINQSQLDVTIGAHRIAYKPFVVECARE